MKYDNFKKLLNGFAQGISIVLALTLLSACTTSTPAIVEHKESIVHRPSGTMKLIKMNSGDSLADIAKSHNIPVERLAAINGINYPYYADKERAILVPHEESKVETYGNDLAQPKIIAEDTAIQSGRIVAEPLGNNQSLVQHPNQELDELNQALDKTLQDGPQNTINTGASAVNYFKYPTPLNLPEFNWPVQGKIIKPFDASRAGFNEGISIAANLDDPVLAAAEGNVIYANNSADRFGNLVILKHKDGYVTAYAHNNQLLVKKGDFVKKAQVIAKAGKTGAVDTTQVYFSMKQNKQIINPESNFLSR